MIETVDDEEYDDDDEEDTYEYYDCGLDNHGNCGKVGSEECEFECPFRNLVKN